MIRLNVFIQVNESNRNAALETAKELVAQSLNDNGCTYDLRDMEGCRITGCTRKSSTFCNLGS